MAIRSDSELLSKSCVDAANYPKNLVRYETSRYHLEDYFERLASNSLRLCCEDGKAGLDIFEYDDVVKEFQHTFATSIFELKGRLEGVRLFEQDDPRCRMVFIQAPHSRERLRISLKMLVCVLTHHQVMPEVLDFIFPFGLQEYTLDSHFSGFCEKTRLEPTGLIVPRLGRSGKEIRLCYNLKSVEVSRGNVSWPWSIRQTAVYHSFDLETGKSFWIVVKGNQLIKNRVQASTDFSNIANPLNSFGTIAEAFSSSLDTHLLICDWSGDEWRWYINYIEQRLHDATRHSLAKTINRPPSISEEPAPPPPNPTPSFVRRAFSSLTKRTVSTASRWTKTSSKLGNEDFRPSFPLPTSPAPNNPKQPPPPPTLPPGFPGSRQNQSLEKADEFTFRDLQQVQFLEENANEVSLVLETNIDILTDLKNHYAEVLSSGKCDKELASVSQKGFASFDKRIASIVTHLKRQHARNKLLQQLLSDRKGLLYGILNNRSLEASKLLAKKTQLSTERMEAMTDSMHDIAKKTKLETVSMKIITLVTLFFLPGTFISTIMSTDIVRFPASPDRTGKIFQPEALQIYLGITIPFMVLTFVAWYGLYWWTKRRDRDARQQNPVKSWSSYV